VRTINPNKIVRSVKSEIIVSSKFFFCIFFCQKCSAIPADSALALEAVGDF
jgi:hypothetical protein